MKKIISFVFLIISAGSSFAESNSEKYIITPNGIQITIPYEKEYRKHFPYTPYSTVWHQTTACTATQSGTTASIGITHELAIQKKARDKGQQVQWATGHTEIATKVFNIATQDICDDGATPSNVVVNGTTVK